MLPRLSAAQKNVVRHPQTRRLLQIHFHLQAEKMTAGLVLRALLTRFAMDERYKIVFSGELQEGFSSDDVTPALVRLFNMDEEMASALLWRGKKTVIKKNLDREEAQKYHKKLTEIGLKADVFKMEEPGDTREEEAVTFFSSAEPAAASGPSHAGPKPSGEIQEDTVFTENPYAAPRVDLTRERAKDNRWLETPEKVAASHGWTWIKEALALMSAAPFLWVAMGIIGAILLGIVSLVPIIGSFLSTMLGVVVAGGLMLAAAEVDSGGALRFGYLFAGFSHPRRNSLFGVGLIYICLSLGIGIIVALIGVLFSVTGAILSGGADPMSSLLSGANVPVVLIAVLLVLALLIPLVMALWFAAPLVVLADKRATESMKMSLIACARNWLPFLVYSLVMLLAALVVAAVIGLPIFLLLQSSLGSTVSVLIFPVAGMILFAGVLATVNSLSVYTAFEDIFSR